MLPFLKIVKETLKEQAKVLDLGCNCGYETKRMKELGLLPVGLDFSEKSIELAKAKNRTIYLILKIICYNTLR